MILLWGLLTGMGVGVVVFTTLACLALDDTLHRRMWWGWRVVMGSITIACLFLASLSLALMIWLIYH